MRQSLSRLSFRFACFALVAELTATCRAQPYTYEFVDGAGGNQRGHTLSGSITFDEVCGKQCTAANVVGFQISVTGEKGFELGFNPSVPLVTLGDTSATWSFVEVTRFQITLDRAPPPSLSVLGEFQLGELDLGLWCNGGSPAARMAHGILMLE